MLNLKFEIKLVLNLDVSSKILLEKDGCVLNNYEAGISWHKMKL